MHMINPSLISVIIQGPLYRKLSPSRGIEHCIDSLRYHLPGAEIVVSTWTDEDVADLDVEVTIQSEDPGFMRDCSGNIININRQLVSTLAGIKASTRPYVMKFRADHNLTSSAFARLGEYTEVPKHGRLFQQPITISNLFVRDPLRFPMLYHISDLVGFGTREDMLKFWEHKVFAYHELFKPRPNINPFGNFLGFSAMKLNPEQALMTALLRKHGLNVDLAYPCEVRSADLELWETILHADFRTLEWKESGVDFPERFVCSNSCLSTVFSAGDIRIAAELGPAERQIRRVRVWINQYLLNCLRLAWWRACASIILFSISPSFAKRVRHVWRRLSGLEHPSPEKV